MKEDAIRRIFNWMQGKKDYPYSIELGPTLRCNLNCLFCWRYGKKKIVSNELTLNEYKDIVRQAASMNVKEIRIIGGGEPLLYNGLIEIMKDIKKYNMFGYICTNGTLLEDKVETLVKIGWDHIKVSIHGSNAKTHDMLVSKKGAFKKAVTALKKAADLKRKFKTDKPKLEIGMVLVNKNYKEVPGMFRLAKEIGVNSVFIEPVTVYTKMGKTLLLNEKQSKEFVKIARETFIKFKGIETNLNFFFETKAHEYTGHMDKLMAKSVKFTKLQNKFLKAACYEPFWRMGIRVDGTVCPCGFNDITSKENIRKNTLKEIWFSEYFEKRRRDLLNWNLPEHCKKCCTTLVRNNMMIRNILSRWIKESS